jgi:hypothetical protein
VGIFNERGRPCPRKDNGKRVKYIEHFETSPEPAGEFYSNLVKIVLVQNKGQILFKGEINYKNANEGLGHLKFFSRTTEPEWVIFI